MRKAKNILKIAVTWITFLSLFSACTPLRKIVMFDKDIPIDKNLNYTYEEYTLAPGDIISIYLQSVSPETYEYLKPNFSNNIRESTSDYERGIKINEEGEISLPYLGDIKVEGLSVAQVEDTLEVRYEEFIKEPIVDVRLLNFYVSVLGQVINPGKINIEGENISLLEAVALAGGPNINGNRKKTILIRQTPDGGSKKYHLDLTSKNLIEPNIIYLKRGDVIYVPETRRSYLGKELQILNIAVSGLVSILTLIILIQRTTP